MFEQAEEQVNRAQKDSLKVQALTNRVALLVAQYEEQLAEYRADATIRINELQATIAAQAEEVRGLKRKIRELNGDVPSQEAQAADEG